MILETNREYEAAAAHFDSAYSYFSRIGSPYADQALEARFRVEDPFVQGHSYLQAGQFSDALAHYRAVLRAHPDLLRGHLFIAQVFSQAGPPDSVEASYRRALAQDPDYADASNGLARHYALLGENLDEALGLSNRSLELDPENAHYLDTLAEIYFRLGRFDEAKVANDQARVNAADEELIESIEERAQRIEAALKGR